MRVSAAPGQLTVADEGPGIPPEAIPQAFERFHLRARADHNSAEGAGLGLAIARCLSLSGARVIIAGRRAEGRLFA